MASAAVGTASSGGGLAAASMAGHVPALGIKRPVETAFDQYPDFSRMNQGRHNANRVDTFKTVLPLAKKPSTPAGRGAVEPKQGSEALDSVLEICEMAIAKHMRLIREDFGRDLLALGERICNEIDLTLPGQSALISALHGDLNDKVVKIVLEMNDAVRTQTGRVVEVLDLARTSARNSSKSLEVLKGLRDASAGRHEQHQAWQSDWKLCVSSLRQQCTASDETLQRLEGALGESGQRLEELSKTYAQNSQVAMVTAEAAADRIGDLGARLEASIAKESESVQVTMRQHIPEVDWTPVTEKLREGSAAVQKQLTKLIDEVSNIRSNGGGIADDSPTVQAKSGKLSVLPIAGSEHRKSRCGWRASAVDTVEMEAQTDVVETVAIYTQTDKDKKVKPKKKREEVLKSPSKPLKEEVPAEEKIKLKPQALFVDPDQLTQAARNKILAAHYTSAVSDKLQDSGWAQAVAKSNYFTTLCTTVIFLNVVWFAIDTDFNQEFVLTRAPAWIVVIENCFCTFFLMEVVIRFAAFQRKFDALTDLWFCFDFSLALLMSVETWGIPAVVKIYEINNNRVWSGDINGIAGLRLIRMAKLVRMSRLAKLARSVPELMVMFKCTKVAIRSVIVFIGIWFILIYVYALALRMLLGEDVPRFQNVPESMLTLLLEGLMPEHALFIGTDVYSDSSRLFQPLMISFVAIAIWVLMNMLVGVLVELISTVSTAEREMSNFTFLVDKVSSSMESLGYDPHEPMTKAVFLECVKDSRICQCIQQVGSDPQSVADAGKLVFGDYGGAEMSFGSFVDLILEMRGSVPAKVKHFQEQSRFAATLSTETAKSVMTDNKECFTELRSILGSIQREVFEVRDAVVEEESDEEEVRGNRRVTRRAF